MIENDEHTAKTDKDKDTTETTNIDEEAELNDEEKSTTKWRVLFIIGIIWVLMRDRTKETNSVATQTDCEHLSIYELQQED
jgi:hypothetical protein